MNSHFSVEPFVTRLDLFMLVFQSCLLPELLLVVPFTFPFFDSLSFIQSDFGLDVSGLSQALVIAAPTARASTSARRTTYPSTSARRRVRSSTTATSGSLTQRTRVVRSRNDQKLITWIRQCIINLEKVVKTKQAKIDELNARPAPSTERELYLLSEIELIGRQFESEYSRPWSFFENLSLVESKSYLSFARSGQP